MTRITAKSFVVDILPAALYLAGIFYGGSIPLKAPPIDLGLPFDKVMHFVVFGGLQILLVRALRHGPTRPSLARRIWFGVAGASGLGLLLELYQATLPYRSAEFLDWLADTLGALLAGALLYAGGRRFLPRSADPPPAVQPR